MNLLKKVQEKKEDNSYEYNDTIVLEGEVDENLEKAKSILKNITTDAENSTLPMLPTIMRFNYVCNQISKLKTDLGTDNALNTINWDRVNTILQTSKVKDDYNAFEDIHSYDELLEERENCLYACSGIDEDVPYLKRTCRQCNDTFYIRYGELEYFRDKKLSLPKRCVYCRKNLAKPKKVEPMKPIQVEEEPMKSAFTLAFEKAGIVD